MSKESQMIDKLIEVDKQMKATQKQNSNYVYVVFVETRYETGRNYGDWSINYAYEKEIKCIVDNENQAKKIVQDLDNVNKDDDTSYYYEKWEVKHGK